MILRQSERKNAKIKMALQGSAGSGKTMGALLLAKGLTNGDLSKVAIVDTESGSADLYSHLGGYNVITLEQPFTPEKYIQAIDICVKAGMEVVILDSISHCWDYLLDYHSKMAGNSFTNWSKVTPLQNSLVNKILQSPVHVISTMRTKQDYVLNQKNGKFVPEKVGLKAIQRNDLSYEFTLVFDIDIKHFATTSKNRTSLFSSNQDFVITEKTGELIYNWCNSGKKDTDILETIKLEIGQCTTVEGLRHLYVKYSDHQIAIKDMVLERKAVIENVTTQIIPSIQIIQETKIQENGTSSSA
ncbi:MAG: AAA family ATPase [Flavobacteriaceae bacterium]